MTPHIDLRTLLPIVRQAYDAGELQCQIEPEQNGCSYDGPCAIGVGIAPEERQHLAGIICSLLEDGEISAPKDQWLDLIRLQRAHDDAMGLRLRPETVARFPLVIAELEAKWLPLT